MLVDVRNMFRQGYVPKVVATTERLLSNTRNTVGNGYACEAVATTERTRADAR